ncbi:MAG: SCO family protein [Chitinophagaceae bacterium]
MERKKTFISKNFFLIMVILVVGFLITCIYLWETWGSLPYYGKVKNEQGQKNYYMLPDFSFINQDSQIISSDWVKNKIWVTNYFFTTCGTICPAMTNNMGILVQDHIQKNKYNDVKIISFSVDPETDSTAQLKFYGKIHNINPEYWQLATGNKKELYSFAREGLKLIATQMPKAQQGDANDFIHSEKFVLIDKDMHIRGYYDGTKPNEVKQLLIDIDKLR